MPDPDTPCESHRTTGESETSRRGFLGILASAAAALAVSVPAIGFLFSPLRRGESAWRSVGPVESFPVGSTVKVVYSAPDALPWAGFTVADAAWLQRRSETELVAYSIYCTHTGCPVDWFEESGLFMCPCHGGMFHQDGSVAAGPPPRPLDRQQVRIRNGEVEILARGVPRPS